ncbi:MAG: hypothetical protein GX224_01865 [Thermoplasmatales archaeon]|nr:hypothetical protein [Thermoplasmatales archaeon]
MTSGNVERKGAKKEGQGGDAKDARATAKAGAADRPAGQKPASGGRRRAPRRRRDKRTKESTKKQTMLNAGRITPFKYDMNTILSSTNLDDSFSSSFLATVIAKGTRVSSKDAKDFVREHKEQLSKDEIDRICKLIDRYSKYR